jgi:hypothetical protein
MLWYPDIVLLSRATRNVFDAQEVLELVVVFSDTTRKLNPEVWACVRMHDLTTVSNMIELKVNAQGTCSDHS